MIDGPRVLPASRAAPRAMVILLHGYGSNGDDLIGLAPHWQGAVPDTVFLSPNAPEPCPGAPGGFQWWPIGSGSREAGARRAAPAIDAFIDAELARYGLAEDRLALVGFSQGTMMALHVGPRRERSLAGIVGYSGALTDEAALEVEARSRPPILLIHGDADAMVPIAAFHHAAGAFTRLGYDLASHVSPGLGHGIDPAGLELGGRFLQRVLAPPSG